MPRTAVFARRGDHFLLLRGAADKRLWAGRYNGVGGHVERGEDVLTAAHREFKEETGLSADLWLCGIVVVDAGEIGVALFVFTGEAGAGSPRPSAEGAAEWVSPARLAELPSVADVAPILERICSMERGSTPFCARSFYNATGQLEIEFRDQPRGT